MVEGEWGGRCVGLPVRSEWVGGVRGVVWGSGGRERKIVVRGRAGAVG